MEKTTQQIGAEAETLARNYLEKQGLIFKEANFRCKLGEIDLLMYDGKYLAIIEVRYRHSMGFGGGLESITKTKISRIIRASKFYLQQNNLTYRQACRFDVVAIDVLGKQTKIKWVKDAFQANNF